MGGAVAFEPRAPRVALQLLSPCKSCWTGALLRNRFWTNGGLGLLNCKVERCRRRAGLIRSDRSSRLFWSLFVLGAIFQGSVIGTPTGRRSTYLGLLRGAWFTVVLAGLAPTVVDGGSDFRRRPWRFSMSQKKKRK